MSFGKFVSELASGGPGYLVDRVTGLFDGDISPTDSESAAQSTGNDSRSRLYAENVSESKGFAGEYTSPVVPPVMETFVGMPHTRIMSFIDSIGLGQLSSSVTAWKDLATDTTTKATTFHDNIAKEMERGWSGATANSALSAVRGYLGDVHKVDQAVSLIANKMEEAYTGFQQVSYQVPHPSEARADGKLANVVSAVGDKILDVSGMISGADTRRAQDAEDNANEVMRTVYAPVAAQADNNVPKVPSPTTSGSGPGGDNDDGSKEPGGGGSGNSNNPPGNTPDGGKPGADNPGTEDPGTGNPNEDDNADDDSNDTSDDNSSKSTEPAAAQTPGNAAPTTPSSAAPSTPSGLGSGGSHGGGSPSGSGSPGAGSGTPGAGGSVPGSGKSANPTSAGTSGTAASTGRAGMSGMGGMGGGRGGGGKDDESEHNAPDYLRGVHEELLGPETLSVPPVIGDQE
ncbi:PPE domain-containing protein [Nocardia noduli]|uniref:PPE domain-containing protein n=1 Tax=Nocardia noduli TaxID=2815722 RepID=UPI001C22C8F2|nr:PPE domain-containing protein [Nocardia noduli]